MASNSSLRLASGSSARVRSSSPALASSPGSSPAYLAPSSAAAASSSRSRHSLYGNEDYLVLDLGSRVWKVGFSGESSPRAVFDIAAETGSELWDFDAATDRSGRERERECARLVKKWLRKTYYE